MVKYKIKFVKIWLNFKESRDASYMLMKTGLLVYFNVLKYFFLLAVLDSFSLVPFEYPEPDITLRLRPGLELNKKFKLQVNGMLQSITLDNLNHISFTILAVFMSLNPRQLLLFHADFINHAKNWTKIFQ